jgi:hypothetical protein
LLGRLFAFKPPDQYAVIFSMKARGTKDALLKFEDITRETGIILFSNLKSGYLCKIILFIIFLISFPSALFAAEVPLRWSAPAFNADGTPLKDLAGYKIYYGNASRRYDGSIDVGNVTITVVSNLTDGLTYYFSITAYDTSGNESGYSNEVSRFVLGDGDSIDDDGDSSGIAGDHPCTGGNTVNCDDNCPNTYNPDQADADNDGVGDACDNCRYVYNPDQLDSDSYKDDNKSIPGMQHYGNACDPDFNNDGMVTKRDLRKLKRYNGKKLPKRKYKLDLDGDLLIGPQDIYIWSDYFGKAPGPGIGD